LLLSYIAPTAAIPKSGGVIQWTVRRTQEAGIAAVLTGRQEPVHNSVALDQ
jgi:hypothetical protein